MFIYTIKLNRALFFVCCAVILALMGIGVSSAMPTAQTVGATAAVVRTNDDRISFLRNYGWNVESDPVEVMEIAIPSEFDEIYSDYNSIQTEQGYNLKKYCGKRLKRWTYRITNYPGRTDETVYANIYVFEDHVVAGDVSCTSLMGFMHGLSYPSQNENQTGSAALKSA